MPLPTAAPPSGKRWQLAERVSASTGDAPPGQNLNRWPSFNGQTVYGYGTNTTADLPTSEWWIEDWHHLQFKAYLDGALTDDFLVTKEGGRWSSGEVSPEVIDYTTHPSDPSKPFWWLTFYGYPPYAGVIGPGVVSVQLVNIEIDAWVAVDDDGSVAPRPRNCAPTNVNTCGGGLHPIELPPTLDDTEPNFEAVIVRRDEDADRAGPLVGAVRGLTWPRYALTGAAAVITQVERRLSVTHNPPSTRSETRYTLRRIPGYTAITNAALYATWDETTFDDATRPMV